MLKRVAEEHLQEGIVSDELAELIVIGPSQQAGAKRMPLTREKGF